ncbi:MAG: hypothetical protein RMK29_17755 [Myxococcales bacterium]|nr:hypothetical protein [Myxococcota bacterium]MDW8283556.1 hypothetical protein [Myxococcales bacterium]
MLSLRRVIRDCHGFAGAERALLVCGALALVLAIGLLVRSGTGQAGGDARRTLEAGVGPVAAMGSLGSMLGTGPLPQATGEPPRPLGPRPLHEGLPSHRYDGAFIGADGKAYHPTTRLEDVPPVLPSDGRVGGELILYVNGITASRKQHHESLQAIADRTGARVIGIYNASGGMVSDIMQSLGDRLDLGNNPAVNQVADTLYEQIRRGRSPHIMGHSQGALIISRALYDVKNRLMAEDGLSEAEAERLMGRIRVETFGGAAEHYPDGPQYVHYVNRLDIVPAAFGLGPTEKSVRVPVVPLLPRGPTIDVPSWGLGAKNRGAGRGARVIRFNERDNPHSLHTTYLERRIPFEEARR